MYNINISSLASKMNQKKMLNMENYYYFCIPNTKFVHNNLLLSSYHYDYHNNGKIINPFDNRILIDQLKYVADECE